MCLTIIRNILTFTLFFISSAYAASPHDASLEWKTLESQHFLIHFHQGEQEIANELAAIAEQQHLRLTQALNWTPEHKTHLVLSDRYDFSNGWATPLPQNHMTLITRPPSDSGGLEDYSHWLEFVFIHEYVHILHTDMAKAAPGALRNVFGRLPFLFPHIFQPSWFLEGLASEYETDTERGIGRGQSALYRGLMAVEWQQGLKSLSQVNGVISEWPAGQTPYLYGVYFQQFLTQKYGQDRKLKWLERYSQQLFPFMVNTALDYAYDKNLPSLWLEFEADLEKRFAREYQQYQVTPQTSTAISKQGHYSGFSQLMENGDLYFIGDSLYDESKLYRLEKDEKQAVAISDIYSQTFDVHPQQGILLVQPDITANSNIFNEIYLLPHHSNSPQRLTQQGRYQSAIWHQQQIIAVHYELGQFALHRLNNQGKLLEVLWQGERGLVLSSISRSPNGKQLVSSMLKQGAGWDLALFDLQQKKWTKITHNDGIEMQARFSRDGESIIFSADYERYFEIYQLQLEGMKLNQLTSSWGGAQYPVLSHDGRTLYYNKLTNNGWDLHSTTPLSRARTLPTNSRLQASYKQANAVETTLHEYDAFSHIMPAWWFPYFSIFEDQVLFGASTSGNDPLYRHQYALSIAADNISEKPSGYMIYRYDRWRTGLQVTAERSNSFYYNDAMAETIAVSSSDEITLSTETPFLFRDQQWAVHSGIILERDHYSYLSDNITSTPPQKSNSLFGLALSFNNSRYFQRSISPIDGRSINLVVEENDLMGGSYQGQVQRFEWNEYIRLGKASVAALRYSAGRGDEQTPRFSLGGVVNTQVTRPGMGLLLPPFNNFDFPLRGYPEGLAGLQGQSMQLVSAELRLPLMRLEKTASAPPVGLQQLHGTLFYDIGSAWDKDQTAEKKHGVGVELHSELLLGYRFPITLTIGTAKGLDIGGETQLYMRLFGAF